MLLSSDPSMTPGTPPLLHPWHLSEQAGCYCRLYTLHGLRAGRGEECDVSSQGCSRLERPSAWRERWGQEEQRLRGALIGWCSQRAAKEDGSDAITGLLLSAPWTFGPVSDRMRSCHMISRSYLHSGIFPDRIELFPGMVVSTDYQPNR